jgi:hypothetical protein
MGAGGAGSEANVQLACRVRVGTRGPVDAAGDALRDGQRAASRYPALWGCRRESWCEGRAQWEA